MHYVGLLNDLARRCWNGFQIALDDFGDLLDDLEKDAVLINQLHNQSIRNRPRRSSLRLSNLPSMSRPSDVVQVGHLIGGCMNGNR